MYPHRVDEAIQDGPPKAGRIAQLIGGEHKRLREYFNEFASHLSLSPQALRHLLDLSSDSFAELRMHQPFRLAVALVNLQVLYSFLSLIGIEAVRCMQVAECAKNVHLAKRMEDLKYRGQAVFNEVICRIKKEENISEKY